MIIHSIQAENFMKYRSLRITELPESGLVAIVGENESGKTSLGQAILFSIFGEAPEGDPLRLIHWDSDQMKVALEFTAEGHGRFVVYREIDRRGTNYVKLRSKDDEKDTCSGIIAVGKRMGQMLGVTADEFTVSFFMAQKDADFLRPHRDGPSTVLDRILGLDSLLAVAESARSSLADIRRGTAKIAEELKVRESIYQGSFEDPERELLFIKEIDEIQQVVQRISGQVQDLVASEQALSAEGVRREEGLNGIEALRTSRDLGRTLDGIDGLLRLDDSPHPDATVNAALEGVKGEQERFRAPLKVLREFLRGLMELRSSVGSHGEELYARIRTEAATAQRAGKSYLSLSRWSRRIGYLAIVFLVIAAAATAWWVYADDNYPDKKMIGTILGLEWTRSTLLWGLGGAALISFVLFFFCTRSSLRMRRSRLKEEGLKKRTEDLLRELEERKAFCVSYGERGSDLPAAQIEDLHHKEITAAMVSLQKAHPELSSEGHQASPLWDQIVTAGQAARVAMEEKQHSVAEERASHEEILAEQKGKLRESEEAITAFRQKQEMLRSLGEEKTALEEDLQRARREAKVHETLAEESAAAAAGMRCRFGPALARFLKPILPRVTRGRYTNVQVGPDLTVKVFSQDKNDFLSLDELSGGTLEQLLLSVRLGLSQALILSRGEAGLGAQFLFLDEPFPSSDRKRSMEFARLLQEMGAFAQVFVTTQAEEVLYDGYDVVVRTRLELSELAVSGADKTPGSSPDPDPDPEADA